MNSVLDQDLDWPEALRTWAAPFLAALAHPAQRQWAPFYLEGLLLPGERKSMAPIASRVAPRDQQQLHNFISDSPWDILPLQAVLVQKANLLVGGQSSSLQVDDVSLVKKGEHSVGVAHQWCGALGKNANCQSLVSLTLARGQVPVTLGLRLYLPKAWAQDPARRQECGVPEEVVYQPKWQIALEEIDRVLAQGALFGLAQADAAYGMVAAFRRGLTQRELPYTVGVLKTQKVFSLNVAPAPGGRKYPQWSQPSIAADKLLARLGEGAWRKLSWRKGTQGALAAEFIAVRVRAADGEADGWDQRAPGETVWLIAERREGGAVKYYFSTLPGSATLLELARSVKGRWVCEQPHQQLKEELGLDHYEGRGWRGLHHHCLLTMMAFCFLQHLRLAGKKKGVLERAAAPAQPARGAPGADRAAA